MTITWQTSVPKVSEYMCIRVRRASRCTPAPHFSGTDGQVTGFLIGIQNDASNVLITDVDCESNGTGIVNNGARASYSFLNASSSFSHGFVNNGAAGLKISAVNADNNKLDGLVLVNTSGALLGDFSEADGNGASGITVSGGGGNTRS